MASNPHSDFTTHIRTLPTLSNLQFSPHVISLHSMKYLNMPYADQTTRRASGKNPAHAQFPNSTQNAQLAMYDFQAANFCLTYVNNE